MEKCLVRCLLRDKTWEKASNVRKPSEIDAFRDGRSVKRHRLLIELQD